MKGRDLKKILNDFTTVLNGSGAGKGRSIENTAAELAQGVENASGRSLTGYRHGMNSLDSHERTQDLDCHYPLNGNPTVEQYKQMYDEEGIAARLVGCMPASCWGMYPDVFINEGRQKHPWEIALKKLSNRIPYMSYMSRLDRISRIGHYGVMLYGFNDSADLSKPVRRNKKLQLKYLRCYQEYYAPINKLVLNPKNERNGYPLTYNITMGLSNVDSNGMGGRSPMMMESDQLSLNGTPVHWSRILHVADNRDDNEIYGVPVMQQLFRRLLDLRKVYASSAEMYFQGAFPGFSFETHPDLADDADLDIDSIIEVLEDYQNHFKRYLASTGGVFKSLAPQVSDPSKQIEAYVAAICAVVGIPIPVFMGQESGQLASSINFKMFNTRIRERQLLHCEPNMLRTFFGDMEKYGVLPKRKDGDEIKVNWRDPNTMSDKEKADVAVSYSQVLMQYAQSGAEKIVPMEYLYTWMLNMTESMSDDILTKVLQMKDGDYITKELWTATQAQQKAAVAGAQAKNVPSGGGKIKKTQKQTKAGAASRSKRSKPIAA